MMYVFLIIAGIILQIVGADILVKQGICFAKTTKNSMFNTAILLGISGAAGWNIVNAILCGEQHQTQNVMTTSVMGSLFMILLILGVCAMTGKMKIPRGTMEREFSYLIIVAIVVLYLSADYLFHGKRAVRVVSRVDGIILIIFFIYYIYMTGKITRKMVKDNENVKIESALLLKCGCSIVVIICGYLLLSCGWNGMKNVISLPVSEGDVDYSAAIMMGVLPALWICVFAWKQGKQDYVIGNVIGCSIVNLTIVVGAAAVISPIMVSVSEIYDMIALCCSAVCVWIFAYKNNELQRIHGCVMATMFVAYVVYRIL